MPLDESSALIDGMHHERDQCGAKGGLLSVVVPVFNERDNIAPLIEEIRAALEGFCSFEIIYVDDGSSDGSRELLAELESSPSLRLRVEFSETRRGQSSAIARGVRAAKGAWIATLDGDGQNVPADIPKLVRRASEACGDGDVVCVAGIRTARRDSSMRRLSSRVANNVRSWLLEDDITDTGCGLKVFRRDAFLALPHFDHFHRFIPALFKFSGGKVVTEPVRHRPRTRGSSKYGVANRLWSGIVDLAGVSWLRRRAIHRPWSTGEGKD